MLKSREPKSRISKCPNLKRVKISKTNVEISKLLSWNVKILKGSKFWKPKSQKGQNLENQYQNLESLKISEVRVSKGLKFREPMAKFRNYHNLEMSKSRNPNLKSQNLEIDKISRANVRTSKGSTFWKFKSQKGQNLENQNLEFSKIIIRAITQIWLYSIHAPK